ncbi:type II secretion system protein GspG [Wohlfahrtiimonas larvae]|uniref:GspG family T2SS major pseudopilin variant LspG n=2 Tax=Wohlfahrtiimonas larvae TaxID=1157986 RepID=A0ABP9N0B9_9GAMM
MTKQSLGFLYRKSLSLVELMIISIIVAIVITILGQKFLGFDDDSQLVEVKQNIRSIEGALNLYYKDIGQYPTTEQGLRSLIENPNLDHWGGPYLSKDLIINPWGKSYQYESLGREYVIFSDQQHNH